MSEKITDTELIELIQEHANKKDQYNELIFRALIGGFTVFPVLLSIINLIYLFTLKKDELSKREEVKVEVTTMIIGSLIIYHL